MAKATTMAIYQSRRELGIELMGLDISVGMPALWKRELDPAEFHGLMVAFHALDSALLASGRPPHTEPLNLPEEDLFEAQMYGYRGLHTVRRLAAYWALCARRPSAEEREIDATEDPVLQALYDSHSKYMDEAEWPRGLGALFRRPKARPKFGHLLLHSDAEGFYVPQQFDDVIFDWAEPQRPGLGGMVGSSFALLTECEELAALIGLPGDMDPEDDALWEAADRPPANGDDWTAFGIEAFCLARLIGACRHSARLGAVVLFS